MAEPRHLTASVRLVQHGIAPFLVVAGQAHHGRVATAFIQNPRGGRGVGAGLPAPKVSNRPQAVFW